ncbi:MAG: hypothetical protein WC781_05470 [Candidatus Pacearchaeota archaeon]|jgi:hypothetical protein
MNNKKLTPTEQLVYNTYKKNESKIKYKYDLIEILAKKHKKKMSEQTLNVYLTRIKNKGIKEFNFSFDYSND